MPANTIFRLQFLCDLIPPLLHSIPESTFKSKPMPDKWSQQEILGHLIDSAANNHQRFIRTQYETDYHLVYAQNEWNRLNNYNQLPKSHVIQFWELYNWHLIEVIKAIPESALQLTCTTNEPQPVTLQWLINDYVAHMEHHLKQILAY